MAVISVPIKPGDDAYEVVHAAWVLNGRTASFERMGEWGGAIYHVIDRDLDEPIIYQADSMPPTEFSNIKPWGRSIKMGWAFANKLGYSTEKFWDDDKGRIFVEFVPRPNELEPNDTGI